VQQKLCVLLGESAEADSTFVSALMTRITCTLSFLAFRYYTDANSAFKRFDAFDNRDTYSFSMTSKFLINWPIWTPK